MLQQAVKNYLQKKTPTSEVGVAGNCMLAKAVGRGDKPGRESHRGLESTWNTCYSASMKTVLHYCVEEWLPFTGFPNRISDGIASVEGGQPQEWRASILDLVVKPGCGLAGANPASLILRSLTVLGTTA